MKKRKFSQAESSLIDPDEILADSISALNTGGTIWEGKIEKPIGRFSSRIFLLFILLGLGYLLMRAEHLQIAQGDDFYTQSQQNRFVTRSLFPPRGIFYDMNHKPLVENIPSFSILFEKDAFMNAIASSNDATDACIGVTETNQTPHAPFIRNCASAPSTPSERLADTLTLLGRVIKKDNAFFWSLGFPKDFGLRATSRELVIARDVPLDTVAEISARRENLPGIEIIESYRRDYAHPYAMSHVLGFTGKISERDLRDNPTYKLEESIGKNGLEQFYDATLRGTVGKKIIEVDSRGKETRFRLTETPHEGSPLLLTLDGDLQHVAYDMLKNYTSGQRGASAVVMDVQSGAIRALVSFPGFDSNALSSGISADAFQKLVANRLSPMFNRSISGEFPSGSVIKPMFAAAALQEHIIDPHKKIFAQGFIKIPHPYRPGEFSVFNDWRAHGWIDLYDAIAYSADVYFYMIGGGYQDQKGLGIDRLKKYASAFGLGSKLGIDLPGEKQGSFPDPSVKAVTYPKDPIWRIGDTYNVSIGQGGVKTTPLQITAMIAAIANGGTLYRPHLLAAVLDEEGDIVTNVSPEIIRERMIDPPYIKEARIGMRQTVVSGTARILNDVPVTVAAKTGTAETGTTPHAWFVAFAPYEKPEIAITVMVEHGGEGSSIAAPITREILKWYFGLRGKADETKKVIDNASSSPSVLPTISPIDQAQH